LSRRWGGYGSSMTKTSRRSSIATWAGALVLGAGLLVHNAPPTSADVCDDGRVAASGCTDPASPPQAAPQDNPAWLRAIQQRDPQFADSYAAMRERILKDGAIPAKYKLLMGMITDTIAAHPDGVRTLADNARAAGASEAEITEAVEVGYLYGGTASLAMGANAFHGG
jgi:alkylhydroperoxidase/carboxymuconolactone decarboxylase family protein YurZ